MFHLPWNIFVTDKKSSIFRIQKKTSLINRWYICHKNNKKSNGTKMPLFLLRCDESYLIIVLAPVLLGLENYGS